MVFRAAIVCGLCGCNLVYGLDPTRLDTGSPRAIFFDNGQSPNDLVDFPALIIPDQTFDFTGVDPRRNIRFVDPGGAELPFEIEAWNPDGESRLWVRVPRIAARSRTDLIEMHYGPNVTGAEDAAGTWRDFGLVAHGVAADGTIHNAASAPVVGRAPTPIMARSGIVGDAIALPDLITFTNSEPLFDGWPQFTLEAWIYADYPTTNIGGEALFLDRGSSISLGRVRDQGIPSALILQIDTHYLNGNDSYLMSVLPLRRWTYLVYAYDGQVLFASVNGTLANAESFATPSPMVSSRLPLQLGGRNAPRFTGMLDEVRVSPVYRDPDWIAAQHRTMTNAFVSFGRPKQ